ncbi:hypothetical protein [Microcoleus sp. AT9b-C3]|uniref:hypothetical protein n=2 Tax=Microcoleus TaxID=44471 RepID=UPI002FCFC086
MKFPWQKPDRKDQLIETYRQALSAYADPANWSDVSCYGHLKPRRWKGGGDGADLALQALQQTEYSPAKKLQKED